MNVCAAAWLARNDSTIAKDRAMVLEYCHKLKRTKHDKTIQKRAQMTYIPILRSGGKVCTTHTQAKVVVVSRSNYPIRPILLI
jgi:hypothetical protein